MVLDKVVERNLRLDNLGSYLASHSFGMGNQEVTLQVCARLVNKKERERQIKRNRNGSSGH